MYTKFKQRWLEEQESENNSSDGEEDESVKAKEKKPLLWKHLNKDGYTPLTLAAKLGQAEMFSFLLEERKITQWSYGPVSCVLYPLDQVDLEFQKEDEGGEEGGEADDEDVKRIKLKFFHINKYFN
jgi:hypothetical protein